jgi:hypothetical protein
MGLEINEVTNYLNFALNFSMYCKKEFLELFKKLLL